MTIQLPDELAEAVLRAAAKSGYKSLVTELLSAGIKASSMRGAALTIAEAYGHTDIAEVLRAAILNEKDAPVDPKLSDDLAEAALRAASKSGYKSLVKELLNHGVKASAMEGAALTLADFYGHFDVADVLRTAILKEQNTATYPSP